MGESDQQVRLQKVLAAAGVGSRRACEDLIAHGRVSVDGRVVTQLGVRVDPRQAVVRVDEQRIEIRPDVIYLALNKPRGVLSAMSDDRGRPTVGDMVRGYSQRLFHIGRLDADSEGLLLLTNDGEFAHRLSHPSFGVRKTYLADVFGPVDRGLAARLRRGIELDDGPVRVDSFRVVQSHGGRALVEVVLHEGRNRIVRRMLAAVGHPVSRLVRTAVGPVLLGQQTPGTVRALTTREVSALWNAVDPATDR
ncbi:MAG: rRNA pseudouridine synthase [Actinobacteria bacterium]|nr:rRNA pseudouridine synthase [Actinomycetota bacterium]